MVVEKMANGVLGGVTNGNDLVAAYARAGKHFPSAVVEIACKMADVGDRGQVYFRKSDSFHDWCSVAAH
ncbi:hypothetical protein RRF57_002889 [Xylaria bambusicola]|uniref:Uncharacterized protein n=1 Tax=Xylaria bambusicola TaxID=326684 RepID=A0AAN7UDT0_9PEZI